MNPRIEARLVAVIACLAGIFVTLLLPKGERRKGAAFFIGWLVPGAGHALLGRWRKGLFFFSLLSGIWLLGNWIVGFRPVSFDDNPFYYVGQYGSGATYLLSQFMSGGKAFPREALHPSWFDPGLLYVCVTGLLNLVVMMNVLELRATAPAPVPAAAEAAKPAEAGPAVAPQPSPEKGA